MKKLKINKGASVEMIAGADKGKRGNVLEIDKNRLRIKVSGVRVQTHYDRQEGLKKMEGFVDYSNVKLIKQAEAGAQKKKKASKKKATKKAASK